MDDLALGRMKAIAHKHIESSPPDPPRKYLKGDEFVVEGKMTYTIIRAYSGRSGMYEVEWSASRNNRDGNKLTYRMPVDEKTLDGWLFIGGCW